MVERYPDNQARRRFLSGADPWLLAHAMVYGGAVVTLEQRVKDDSKQAKIPNVGDNFRVQSMTTYGMLRELGISWS